ncbi:MAG: hypothetical protein K0R39_2299 [Symbiobacteriaceae bacterium]|jgi:hypothetical protein|nr:hypothetical protein [Symbiobacteriaceae bacterium]
MDRFVERFQAAIEKELLRALFLVRVIAVLLFFAGLIFTPLPWKLFVFGPFFLAPLMAEVCRRLPESWFGPDAAAVEAERRRVRRILYE